MALAPLGVLAVVGVSRVASAGMGPRHDKKKEARSSRHAAEHASIDSVSGGGDEQAPTSMPAGGESARSY
eukprot:scaffold57995_cov28-Tisochrysis_lutea.AAC.2